MLCLWNTPGGIWNFLPKAVQSNDKVVLECWINKKVIYLVLSLQSSKTLGSNSTSFYHEAGCRVSALFLAYFSIVSPLFEKPVPQKSMLSQLYWPTWVYSFMDWLSFQPLHHTINSFLAGNSLSFLRLWIIHMF